MRVRRKKMKKSTKKNDKTIFIAAAIMFACAIGLFVGAFARFQTVVGGSATLKTADWSFMVNGGTADFSVNLADGTAYNLVEVGGEKEFNQVHMVYSHQYYQQKVVMLMLHIMLPLAA